MLDQESISQQVIAMSPTPVFLIYLWNRNTLPLSVGWRNTRLTTSLGRVTVPCKKPRQSFSLQLTPSFWPIIMLVTAMSVVNSSQSWRHQSSSISVACALSLQVWRLCQDEPQRGMERVVRTMQVSLALTGKLLYEVSCHFQLEVLFPLPRQLLNPSSRAVSTFLPTTFVRRYSFVHSLFSVLQDGLWTS